MKGKVNVYLHLISSLETPVYVSNFMVITIAGFNWIKNGKNAALWRCWCTKDKTYLYALKLKGILSIVISNVFNRTLHIVKWCLKMALSMKICFEFELCPKRDLKQPV